MTIRLAAEGDLPEVERLAELDERAIPAGPVLVGEIDEAMVALLPLGDGPMISDPWAPAGEIAELLELRRAQLRALPPAA
jgi:hypothetical protein